MGNYSLKVAPDEDRLRFLIEGRIDATAATEFSAAVAEARADRPKGRMVFDCKGLEYISSAGLRVFLSLKKKEAAPIRLVNVSRGVAEILDVTGFSQLLDVSRAVRSISPKECRFIGRSHSISIYQMPDDTIMKVYPDGATQEDVERERKNAQTALLNGIPTLIAYDVVEHEGSYGLLYERLKLDTVSSTLDDMPWKLDKWAAKMGELLRIVHAADPDPDALPRTQDILEAQAHQMKGRLNEREVWALIRLIRAIPQTQGIVYGKYHEHNVFIQKDELLLVNMADLSLGDPIHDLGTVYMLHVLEAERFAKTFQNISATQLKRAWDVMIRAYLDTDDEEAVAACEQIVHASGLLRSALYPATARLSPDDEERFVALARRDVFPAIDHLAKQLSLARSLAPDA